MGFSSVCARSAPPPHSRTIRISRKHRPEKSKAPQTCLPLIASFRPSPRETWRWLNFRRRKFRPSVKRRITHLHELYFLLLSSESVPPIRNRRFTTSEQLALRAVDQPPFQHPPSKEDHAPSIGRIAFDVMSSAQNQKPLDERLQEAARRAEEELRRFARYLDEEVVPEVRRNSSTALRAAAVRLQKLADTMDESRSDRPKPGSPSSNS